VNDPLIRIGVGLNTSVGVTTNGLGVGIGVMVGSGDGGMVVAVGVGYVEGVVDMGRISKRVKLKQIHGMKRMKIIIKKRRI
jgi:hypothetical protein